MSNPSIGLRLSKEAVAALDSKCQQTGKSRTQVVEQLLLPGTDTPTIVTSGYHVGDKLPPNFEIREVRVQKTEVQKLLVFPKDRVVAVRRCSANGRKIWLEVAAVYPEEVWERASYLPTWRSEPMTALLQATKDVEAYHLKLNHPTTKEARAAGWKFPDWRAWNYSLVEYVQEAEMYLAEQAATEQPCDNAQQSPLNEVLVR